MTKSRFLGWCRWLNHSALKSTTNRWHIWSKLCLPAMWWYAERESHCMAPFKSIIWALFMKKRDTGMPWDFGWFDGWRPERELAGADLDIQSCWSWIYASRESWNCWFGVEKATALGLSQVNLHIAAASHLVSTTTRFGYAHYYTRRPCFWRVFTMTFPEDRVGFVESHEYTFWSFLL